MTTYTAAVNDYNTAVQVFLGRSTDEQLALLWYVYKQMGDRVTPAAPGAAADGIAAGLYDQVKVLPQNRQLETMRAIAQSTQQDQISREYGSLSDNTQLAFWLFLARGMDAGDIIPMPESYDLTAEGQDWLAAIETMDFETQITVLRNSVQAMGGEPRSGAAI
ncbi:Orange carotenoid protein [filamentous cyanobacterium CCP5]|nr:Orange carotenoid protein [filamentous cyanobacterium CCP5]